MHHGHGCGVSEGSITNQPYLFISTGELDDQNFHKMPRTSPDHAPLRVARGGKRLVQHLNSTQKSAYLANCNLTNELQ